MGPISLEKLITPESPISVQGGDCRKWMLCEIIHLVHTSSNYPAILIHQELQVLEITGMLNNAVWHNLQKKSKLLIDIQRCLDDDIHNFVLSIQCLLMLWNQNYDICMDSNNEVLWLPTVARMSSEWLYFPGTKITVTIISNSPLCMMTGNTQKTIE